MALTDLLARGETANVDLKAPISFEGDDRVELVKDIIAMANTRDGGTLVIGVSEVDGQPRVDGLTTAQVTSFDVTKVAAAVHERSAPPVKLSVTTEEHQGKVIVLIQVQEFDDQPIICTKDGAPSTGKTIFRRGDLLMRSSAAQSTRVSTESDMRDLLNRAVKRRADLILTDISSIMKGVTTPRESEEERLQRHWETTRRFAGAVAEESMKPFHGLGRWKLEFWPSVPVQVPSMDHSRLQKILRETSVRLRGWDFPHIPRQIINRQDDETQRRYVTLFTDWYTYAEHTILTEDGYFRHEQVLWEDLQGRPFSEAPGAGSPGAVLDWIGTLFTLGEFTLFAGRLASELGFQGEVCLHVELSGIGSPRRLGTTDPLRDLWYGFTSQRSSITLRKVMQTAVLRADPAAEAIDLARRIYALFGWDNPSEKMLQEDLNRLYTRRL